jgi:Na+-driven multidrug efflux pump
MGTVFARGIGSLIGVWILVTPLLPLKVDLLKGISFDLPLFGKIIYFGGPRSLQGIIRNLARLLTIRIITLLPNSTHTVSAFSICFQVRMISSFIGLAFMSASMARVGYNMGAKKPEDAVKSGWISASMAAILMSIIASFFFLFPEAIMGFFTSDNDVIMLGRLFFLIIAVVEPVMAFAFALSGALRGGGDSISPFIYAGISDLIIAVTLGYYFAITLNLGFTGIALGIAVSALTHAIPMTIKFWNGSWKTIKV